MLPREKWISNWPDLETELKLNSFTKGFKPENNHRDSIARRGRSIPNKSVPSGRFSMVNEGTQTEEGIRSFESWSFIEKARLSRIELSRHESLPIEFYSLIFRGEISKACFLLDAFSLIHFLFSPKFYDNYEISRNWSICDACYTTVNCYLILGPIVLI